ncbi:MAG: hypothetical protein DDT23_00706 [candidate division WS2 bacterium]|nr:hypothetical protein [Candidatus Lithacetigena glycinireducens]
MLKNINIRKFQIDDFPSLVSISNLIYPDYPTTIEELKHWFDNYDHTKYLMKKYVATNEQKEVVAYSYYYHEPILYHPHKFSLELSVHPHWQKQGIGSHFYNLLFKEWVSLNAQIIRVSCREDKEDSLSFIFHRGFKEKRRSWESRLQVQEFILADFTQVFSPIKQQGIVITTLAEELKKDEAVYEKLYEHHSTTMGDMPLPNTYTRVSFEEFIKRVIKSPNLLPEAFFIAKAGELYVGESYLETSQADATQLYQGQTAVRREFRGKGIAMALKVKVIEFAQKNNYKTIKTWNDSENSSMLGINQRLGFVRQPAWIQFEKEFVK